LNFVSRERLEEREEGARDRKLFGGVAGEESIESRDIFEDIELVRVLEAASNLEIGEPNVEIRDQIRVESLMGALGAELLTDELIKLMDHGEHSIEVGDVGVFFMRDVARERKIGKEGEDIGGIFDIRLLDGVDFGLVNVGVVDLASVEIVSGGRAVLDWGGARRRGGRMFGLLGFDTEKGVHASLELGFSLHGGEELFDLLGREFRHGDRVRLDRAGELKC
jgi:hypothetical protein